MFLLNKSVLFLSISSTNINRTLENNHSSIYDKLFK